MIEHLVAILEQKFKDLTAEEIADILWLTLQQWQSTAATLPKIQPDESDSEPPIVEIIPPDKAAVTPPRPETPPSIPAPPQPKMAGLTTSPQPKTRSQAKSTLGAPLAIPDAPALRSSQEILKAVRPLIRRVPSAQVSYVDVPATVQAIAKTDLWTLKLQPVLEPWLELTIVVDATPSMVIWQRTILSLRRVLAQSGVFRDVRMWSLETQDSSNLSANENSPEPKLCIRSGFGPAAALQPPCRPQELLDPNGRRLILVISDCIAPRWDSQPIRDMLQVWAEHGPMALVQVLPEWLWNRTALSEVVKGQVYSHTPGQSNQSLTFVRRERWRRNIPVGVKVPVLTLEPAVARRWSQMVAGKAAVAAPGLLFSSVSAQGSSLKRSPDSKSPSLAQSTLTPQQRLEQFRNFSSPMARRLAGLLAACPEVNLPIVRMVQAALLPDAQQVHVAEVLLGGLFKPQTGITVHTPADQVQYVFHDNVQPLVQDTVPPDRAFAALSTWLNHRFGYSLADFRAYVTPERIEQVKPFAGILLDVLKRCGDEYAEIVNSIERITELTPQPDLDSSTSIFIRKQTHFVLWRPGASEPTPTLYIGTIESERPNQLTQLGEFPLKQSIEFPDLWEISAQECNLTEGKVYFYWFKVRNTSPYDPANANQIMYCTDPMATTVDRQILAPVPQEPGGVASSYPASVVLYQDGRLIPCDPQGQTVNWEGDVPLETLPTNNRLVIYELPTRWTRIGSDGGIEVGIGTFRDVLALLLPEENSPTSLISDALNNHPYLLELGVNALELLPPADSDDNLNFGYGTANYFAADFDLGRPDYQSPPTASTDFATLIKVCHQNGLRFFLDAVMAFSRNHSYCNVNFRDFYIRWDSSDPEQGAREGFGGDLFKYNYWVEGYHPITGQKARFVPAREYMKTYIAHWMEYYRVDGLRVDSIRHIANNEFVQELKDFAHALWQKRGGSRDRFLVVGEELSVPLALIHQNRLDGLWNEKFKQIIRSVILGRNWSDEPSFEWSVRKLIDCRNLGFIDGSQAVNYLTSHDLDGYGNERLYDFLRRNGIDNIAEIEKRIKLAFACLLTAVGIPMILAGEEFADQHDLDIWSSPNRDQNKQVDPVNYSRIKDDWRQRIFQYVTRLVRFRTSSDALAVVDTQFIQVDISESKRVLVWQRGNKADQLVVVVANFSGYETPFGSEYNVPNWPATPAGKQWKEITQERIVSAEWVGREGIFPWEAKIYTLVKELETETNETSPTASPVDASDIVARTNMELKRLGWTNQQARDYLLETYGKRSRQLLTDAELLDFLHRLESEPSPQD